MRARRDVIQKWMKSVWTDIEKGYLLITYTTDWTTRAPYCIGLGANPLANSIFKGINIESLFSFLYAIIIGVRLKLMVLIINIDALKISKLDVSQTFRTPFGQYVSIIVTQSESSDTSAILLPIYWQVNHLLSGEILNLVNCDIKYLHISCCYFVKMSSRIKRYLSQIIFQ